MRFQVTIVTLEIVAVTENEVQSQQFDILYFRI